jgi:hypothetical protein
MINSRLFLNSNCPSFRSEKSFTLSYYIEESGQAFKDFHHDIIISGIGLVRDLGTSTKFTKRSIHCTGRKLSQG